MRHRYLLYVIALANAVSYASIVPLLPFVVIYNDGSATLAGVLIAVHSLASTCTAPILGRLSDRIWPKLVLVWTLFGIAVAYVVLAFADSLIMIFAARVFSGLMSGNMGVVTAIIVDSSPEKDGGKAISLITAMYAVGYVIGPVLTIGVSWLAPEDVIFYVSLIAASSTVMVALSILVAMPSDFACISEEVTEFSSCTLHQKVSQNNEMGKFTLLFLLAMLSLCQSGITAMQGFWVFDQYGWTERGASFVMLIVAITVIVTQSKILPYFISIINLNRLFFIILIIIIIISFILIIPHNLIIINIIEFSILFSALTSGISVLTTLVSASHKTSSGRGELMGWASFAVGVGRIIGPLVFGLIFTLGGSSILFTLVITITIIIGIILLIKY